MDRSWLVTVEAKSWAIKDYTYISFEAVMEGIVGRRDSHSLVIPLLPSDWTIARICLNATETIDRGGKRRRDGLGVAGPDRNPTFLMNRWM